MIMYKGYIIVFTCQEEYIDYDDMIEEIKKCPSWWKYNDTTWLIATSESAEELWKRIKPKIDKKERYFIVEINADNRQGWLNKSHWEWLKTHLEKKEVIK